MKSSFRSTLLVLATVTAFSLGLVAALSPIATATPPGQGPCSHGNSDKACRPDPQPGSGQDCDPHGNNGGVNEDHCGGTTAATTDTTTTTPASPTTTGSTTGGQTTPGATAPSTPTGPTAGSTTSTSTTGLPAAGDTASPVETIEITPTDADAHASTTQTATVGPRRNSVAGSSKQKARHSTSPKTVTASTTKPKKKADAAKHSSVNRHAKPHANKQKIRKLGALPFTP